MEFRSSSPDDGIGWMKHALLQKGYSGFIKVNLRCKMQYLKFISLSSIFILHSIHYITQEATRDNKKTSEDSPLLILHPPTSLPHTRIHSPPLSQFLSSRSPGKEHSLIQPSSPGCATQTSARDGSSLRAPAYVSLSCVFVCFSDPFGHKQFPALYQTHNSFFR